MNSGGSAAETIADEAEDEGEAEGEAVPEEHGVSPAGRVGGVLAGPEQDEAGDDEALPGDGEKELAAAAAAVELLDLVWGEGALFDGDEECWSCLISPAGSSPASAGFRY